MTIICFKSDRQRRNCRFHHDVCRDPTEPAGEGEERPIKTAPLTLTSPLSLLRIVTLRFTSVIFDSRENLFSYIRPEL